MRWLSNVGGLTVERLGGVKRSGEAADSRPPKGVMHTTEGGWEGSLGVFRTTGTPNFMLGRDGTGRLRLAQFSPIGEMALTLKNLSGGVETNRDAIVQIELVGFSKRTLWLPDAATCRILAALMAELVKDGIPLRRGGDGTRSSSNWTRNAGWFGHGEIPENDHWDPGALNWPELFRLAGGAAPEPEEDDLSTLDQILDLAEWRMVDNADPDRRPASLPAPDKIPQDWFPRLGRIVAIAQGYGAALIFLDWVRWVYIDKRVGERPEGVAKMNEALGLPATSLPQRWWTVAPPIQTLLNDYAARIAEEAGGATAAQIAALERKIAELQAELAADVANDGEREARIRSALEAALAELGA